MIYAYRFPEGQAFDSPVLREKLIVAHRRILMINEVATVTVAETILY